MISMDNTTSESRRKPNEHLNFNTGASLVGDERASGNGKIFRGQPYRVINSGRSFMLKYNFNLYTLKPTKNLNVIKLYTCTQFL